MRSARNSRLWALAYVILCDVFLKAPPSTSTRPVFRLTSCGDDCPFSHDRPEFPSNLSSVFSSMHRQGHVLAPPHVIAVGNLMKNLLTV